jgi:competence protein ComEA
MGAALHRLLSWRYYMPVALTLMVVLLVGSGVELAIRVGGWPPGFLAPHDAITITGPGVTSNGQIQAYVLGAVQQPGVYTLTQGARVHDLIAAAGGTLEEADLSQVSLAAVLGDGQSVYVPRVGETVPPERGGKVDLNAATAEQFHNALGIALSTARRIVAYRAEHGAFTAVSQLLLVPVSRTIYDRIQNLVTV